MARVRGHKRWRGQSIEVRVHVARGTTLTRTVGWQGGKRATEKAADRTLTALLAEVDEGRHAVGADAPLRVLADAWWKHRRPAWSPSTAAAYRSLLNHRILPTLGDRMLRQVTAQVLVDWLDAQGGTPATRAKAWMLVRQVLEHGRRLGWIARNPALDLQSPSVGPTAIQAPSPTDVQRALAALEETNPPMHLFIHLAAATGARRGELVGLRWDDLAGAEVQIRRSVVRGDDGAVHVRPYPKSKKPRTVTVDPATVALLGGHRRRCAADALACGVGFGADAFVFAAEPDGRDPWAPDRATKTWGRARRRLGLDRVRLHDLRHFVATRLLDAGYAPADVAARLGHANAAITQRIYAHAIPARDAEMAGTLAELLA